MGKGTKGKDKKPGFAMGPIDVKPCEGYKQEKNKSVTKYPAVTEGFSKEKLPNRFINDIRQKRTYKEEPDIYAASQRTKP